MTLSFDLEEVIGMSLVYRYGQWSMKFNLMNVGSGLRTIQEEMQFDTLEHARGFIIGLSQYIRRVFYEEESNDGRRIYTERNFFQENLGEEKIQFLAQEGKIRLLCI